LPFKMRVNTCYRFSEPPGAVWLCADARSVEPKSDVTIRAENASLDRIKYVSVELQDQLKHRATN
jgi:hypothetical protein